MPAYANWIDSVLALPSPGDVNGDGWVGGADLTAIITNWGMNGATRDHGDLSGNGTVDGPDYTEVITYWGTGTPPPEPNAIPEPATLGLMILGALAILRRPLVRRSPTCAPKPIGEDAY